MRQKSHKMSDTTTYIVMGHRVTPCHTSGDYDLVMGVTPGGMQGPPPHIHQTYNEVFVVMKGEMEFVLDGISRRVGAGDMVDIPPGCLHTFANNTDVSCTWMNIHSPKGFRAFFETFGVPAAEEGANQRSLSPGRIQEVLERAADFDMQIQLPREAGRSGSQG